MQVRGEVGGRKEPLTSEPDEERLPEGMEWGDPLVFLSWQSSQRGDVGAGIGMARLFSRTHDRLVHCCV